MRPLPEMPAACHRVRRPTAIASTTSLGEGCLSGAGMVKSSLQTLLVGGFTAGAAF
jgi:hypothetical protein